MAKRYLVTVGTSLVDNLSRAKTTAYDNLRDELETRLKVTADYLLGEELPPELVGRASGARDRRAIGAHWLLNHYSRRGFRPEPNLGPHGAELSTLFRLGLKPDDEVLLLCSDTPLGALCAGVTALLLTDPAAGVERVQVIGSQLGGYESQPMADWGWPDAGETAHFNPQILKLRREQVWIRRVPALAPQHRADFEREAAANLIVMIAQSVRQGRRAGLEPQIVFTGGYKAAVPLLTYAAGWLEGVPMSALYQDSEEVLRLPAMAMQPEESVRRAVLGFEAQDERYESFYDYADDKVDAAEMENALRPFFENRTDGGGVRLSLLGEVLRQVLWYEDTERG